MSLQELMAYLVFGGFCALIGALIIAAWLQLRKGTRI